MSSENKVPFYLLQTLSSLKLKHGMDTSELAYKLGVDIAKYEEWEDDSSNIPYNYILKLEEIFQMPARYIYFGRDITLSNPQKNNEK